ncbi:MAG: OB-fold nucleic acid binding domain-containing protein [Ilumatobacteraceae bacterium]
MTELTFGELAAIGIERLKGVGDKKRDALASQDVHSVLDLLMTYPRRWVDRTNEARVSDLIPGQEALVLVTVRSMSRRVGRNRRTIVEGTVGDGTATMHVVFFNQPWREKQLRPGLNIAMFGKAEVYRGGLQMTNPIVDLIGDRTGRIVPIYPQSEKAGLSTWEIAGWVEDALRRCEPRGLADPLPEADPPPVRPDRAHRGVPHDPPARHDGRQGACPAAAGVRRAAARPGAAGDAQARPGARRVGDPSRHRPDASPPACAGHCRTR